MGCDYCSLILKQNGDIKNGKLIYWSEFVSVGIHKNDRETLLVVADDFASHIKINYCPMCGGDLKNDRKNI